MDAKELQARGIEADKIVVALSGFSGKKKDAININLQEDILNGLKENNQLLKELIKEMKANNTAVKTLTTAVKSQK